MLSRLGASVRRLAELSPWTNVYGSARTVLALSTLVTLLASETSSLFRPAAGIPGFPYCDGIAAYSLFCVADPVWGHWVAIVILLMAASGWRPRLTALPHWWVAASFQTSATVLDGGDQVAAVLTLLILPIALSDGRTWHWQKPRPAGDAAIAVLAWSAILVIRIQLAGIYLQASVAKLGKEEWANGTALYYWLRDPLFGAPNWAAPVLEPVLTSAAGVTLLTWGTVAVEFALVFGLVARRAVRPYLLVAGVLLHGSIALIMGLGSFSLAMVAGLMLYLRPPDQPWSLSPLHLRTVTTLRRHLPAVRPFSWGRRRPLAARGALDGNRSP